MIGNQQPPQTALWRRLRPHTGRGISSVSAIAAALGLLWFMVIRADWNPALGAATEWFWVRVLVAAMFYAAEQQITLSYETGTGWFCSRSIAKCHQIPAAAPPIEIMSGGFRAGESNH